MWKLWHKLFGWHYVLAPAGEGGLKIMKIIVIRGKVYIKYNQSYWSIKSFDNYVYVPLTFKSLEDLK